MNYQGGLNSLLEWTFLGKGAFDLTVEERIRIFPWSAEQKTGSPGRGQCLLQNKSARDNPFWKLQVIMPSRSQSFKRKASVHDARKYFSGPNQEALFQVKIFWPQLLLFYLHIQNITL